MIFLEQKKKHLLVLCTVLLITLLTLSPSLGNHFTNWDDIALLTENRDIKALTLDNWHRIFTKNYVGTYIPLTVLAFNIEHALFGDTTFFYYLNNILLHLAVVALVFFVARRLNLSTSASGITALLFGIHPMHVESVAWIAQRKDVLYSVFYLLAVLKYLEYVDGKKRALFIWAIFFGLCSILSKPMAYSLPFILLLFDWWKGRRLDVKVFIEKIPFLVIIGAVSLITYASNPQTILLGPVQCVLVWIWAFCFHLQKFFVPYPLIPAYEMPQPIAFGNPLYMAAVGSFVIFLILCFAMRNQKWFRFAVLFYLLSNFMIIVRAAWEFGNNTVVADRFMYLPSLGICLALGAGCQFLQERLRTRPIYAWIGVFLCSAILVVLVFMSSKQTLVWRNNISLWSYIIKHYPKKSLAYQNRAAGYVELGAYPKANSDLKKALDLEPQNAVLYFCRADLFEKQGDLQSALVDLDHAIALHADYPEAYFRRGKIYQLLGQKEKALQDYDRAVAQAPDMDHAYYNRGMIYDDMGKTDLALADYARVIVINPYHSKAYNNRAVIYINQGDYRKAKVDLLKATKIDSHNREAYDNLRLIQHIN